jgi:hypothetical protein
MFVLRLKFAITVHFYLYKHSIIYKTDQADLLFWIKLDFICIN